MSLLEIIRELTGPSPPPDLMQRICDSIPEAGYVVETGMGYARANSGMLETLKELFPEHTFRIVLCHDRERTYFAITTKDPDPRELSEMEKVGYWDDDHEYHLGKRPSRKFHY